MSPMEPHPVPSLGDNAAAIDQLPSLIGRLQMPSDSSCHASATTLPIELIQEIFSMACAGEVLRLDEDIKDSIQFRIAQVCRSWRIAALDMPSLWTTVETECTESNPLDRAIQQMEYLLPRCKARSLDLHVRDKICYAMTRDLPYHTAFDDRIRALRLEGCTYCTLATCPYISWTNSEILEVLVINNPDLEPGRLASDFCHNDGWRHASSLVGELGFDCSPRLRSLRVTGIFVTSIYTDAQVY